MVDTMDKLYSGKGKTPEEAREKLFSAAKSDGVVNLESTVQYEASVVVREGKTATGKLHENYVVAFASALKAGKINPDQFDSEKNTVEYTAQANYQVPAPQNYRQPGQPGGSSPAGYSGRNLTDLF